MINYIFINSTLLYLILIPIAILIWYFFQHLRISSSIIFTDTKSLTNETTIKEQLRHLPYLLKVISCILLIIALARPQSSTNWEESTTEGIDIVLAIDVSTSMLAEDLKPNRIEAAKNVAVNFISKRVNDRI